MSAKSHEVLEQALALSRSERVKLASSLLESLEPVDPGADVAWDEEIRRRAEELRSGKVTTIPWSEVRAELEAKLTAVD